MMIVSTKKIQIILISIIILTLSCKQPEENHSSQKLWPSLPLSQIEIKDVTLGQPLKDEWWQNRWVNLSGNPMFKNYNDTTLDGRVYKMQFVKTCFPSGFKDDRVELFFEGINKKLGTNFVFDGKEDYIYKTPDYEIVLEVVKCDDYPSPYIDPLTNRIALTITASKLKEQNEKLKEIRAIEEQRQNDSLKKDWQNRIIDDF
jgi:hypothetical protein